MVHISQYVFAFIQELTTAKQVTTCNSFFHKNQYTQYPFIFHLYRLRKATKINGYLSYIIFYIARKIKSNKK